MELIEVHLLLCCPLLLHLSVKMLLVSIPALLSISREIVLFSECVGNNPPILNILLIVKM